MALSKSVCVAAASATALFAAPTFVAPFIGQPNTATVATAGAATSARSQGPSVGTAGLAALGAAAAAVGIVGVAGRRRTAAVVPARRSVQLAGLPSALEGTGGPNPQDVWDPIGLSQGKSEEQLLRWRAVELKHGRVCMLAVLGWFHVAAGWHPIGDELVGGRASDNPLENFTQMPMAGLWQILFTIMCVEWITEYVCTPPEGRPWDIIGWTPLIADEEDADWKEKQVQELNNGRLAMVAITGLVAQDLATGEYAGWIGKFGGGALSPEQVQNQPWPVFGKYSFWPYDQFTSQGAWPDIFPGAHP